jgi:hypothetical protein
MIELIINNPEKVLAKFEIKRRSTQPGNHPDIFYMSHSQGEIPPKSSFLIKVRYISNYPGVMSYETYDLETIGGNKIKFSLSGMCTPLPAYVNCKYVNFKSVELGSSMTKLIRVYNDVILKLSIKYFIIMMEFLVLIILKRLLIRIVMLELILLLNLSRRKFIMKEFFF